MSEKVHAFGKHRGLVGVVSQPDSPRDAPAVLLLNAGLVHRVGPYRMHVDLARRLAAAGYLVLRFEQSAIGASEPRRERLSYEDRAVADGPDAMDFLGARCRGDRFIPLGRCSGALNPPRA